MLEKNYQRNKHHKLPWLNLRCDGLEVAKNQKTLSVIFGDIVYFHVSGVLYFD